MVPNESEWGLVQVCIAVKLTQWSRKSTIWASRAHDFECTWFLGRAFLRTLQSSFRIIGSAISLLFFPKNGFSYDSEACYVPYQKFLPFSRELISIKLNVESDVPSDSKWVNHRWLIESKHKNLFYSLETGFLSADFLYVWEKVISDNLWKNDAFWTATLEVWKMVVFEAEYIMTHSDVTFFWKEKLKFQVSNKRSVTLDLVVRVPEENYRTFKIT